MSPDEIELLIQNANQAIQHRESERSRQIAYLEEIHQNLKTLDDELKSERWRSDPMRLGWKLYILWLDSILCVVKVLAFFRLFEFARNLKRRLKK